ncbi:MAG: N-acetylmuramic acid 6-phosphate etherase [Planctomycetes bacterium]|nr:N-acetylmuramic acid 6-phosphate etherase [Planctomycetota bacterium]
MSGTSRFSDLATEASHPDAAELDLLATADLVRLTLDEGLTAFRACRAAATEIARLADIAASALHAGGRLVYVGAGTSGRLAMLDAVELAPTFGLPMDRVPVLLAGGDAAMFRAQEGAEDRVEDGIHRIRGLRVGPSDVVVGVSASGRTPFVIAALAEARRSGARTAAVTCNPLQPGTNVDVHVLLSTGAEVLAGSTRMNAGTATKMALNALSLAAMVRIGKVYRNRMVDVRVGSAKLEDRAQRLVAELGNADPAAASAALRSAGGHAKSAILMLRRHLTAREARRLLRVHGDSLRAALGRA